MRGAFQLQDDLNYWVYEGERESKSHWIERTQYFLTNSVCELYSHLTVVVRGRGECNDNIPHFASCSSHSSTSSSSSRLISPQQTIHNS